MMDWEQKAVCYERFGKKFEKYEKVKKCATLAKYGVFEALDLMKEASFHLFDTFPAKIEDKTFI